MEASAKRACEIRSCGTEENEAIRSVINESALSYNGVIPSQIYREPWMSEEYLSQELARGVRFVGCFEGSHLLGVMGTQNIEDVTLIRHSYVLSSNRRQGIGTWLLEHQKEKTSRPMLVGCLRAMTWAISFYEKHGFSLVSDGERDRLRARYWTLSSEHVRNSVVLVDTKWRETRHDL